MASKWVEAEKLEENAVLLIKGGDYVVQSVEVDDSWEDENRIYVEVRHFDGYELGGVSDFYFRPDELVEVWAG